MNAAAVLLILGTILEGIGLFAFSDRLRLRRGVAAVLLLAGAILWAAGLGLAIFSG